MTNERRKPSSTFLTVVQPVSKAENEDIEMLMEPMKKQTSQPQ